MMCRLKVISHNSRVFLSRWWGRGRGLESQMPLPPNYHLNLIILVNFLGIDNIINQIWEMLTSALRALVKNLIKESFDITFMGNEKNC